jgi:hypothetical protein
LFFSGVEWLLCRGAGAGNEEKTGIGGDESSVERVVEESVEIQMGGVAKGT